MPAVPDDPVVERVVWALQDPVAAKALADEAPIVDEGGLRKAAKMARGVSQEKGLLSCASADGNPERRRSGACGRKPGRQRVPDRQSPVPGHDEGTACALVGPSSARATAICLGAAQRRPCSFRVLRQQVEGSLAAKGCGDSFPASVSLDGVAGQLNRLSPWLHPWTSDRYLAAASESERRRIEDEAIKSIAPRLVVRAGPPSRLGFQTVFRGQVLLAIRPIDACGHFRLVSW